MNALSALQQLRAEGYTLTLRGPDIRVVSERKVEARTRDGIKSIKPLLVKLLTATADGWTGEDWREYFEERAAIAEHEAKLPRDQAEHRAYECAISEWLSRNPIRSNPGRCRHCAQERGPLFPYVTDRNIADPGHTWMHQSCAKLWHEHRRDLAKAELSEVGIDQPEVGKK